MHSADPTCHVLQNMAIIGGKVENLEEIPSHVWKSLPDCLKLGPSAINQSRVGEYRKVPILFRELQF